MYSSSFIQSTHFLGARESGSVLNFGVGAANEKNIGKCGPFSQAAYILVKG